MLVNLARENEGMCCQRFGLGRDSYHSSFSVSDLRFLVLGRVPLCEVTTLNCLILGRYSSFIRCAHRSVL